MSYVGIMTSDCGAVAFSDSRSTSVLENDQHQLNDNTKKVFLSKQFVLATAGVNEILIGPDKKIRLDEILDDALDGFGKSHREFFDELYKRLRPCFMERPEVQYEFLIGFKDTLDPKRVYFGREHCVISKLGTTYDGLTYSEGTHSMGFRNYTPLNLAFHRDLSVDKMIEVAKIAVETAEKMGDIILEYNSVGGPVQIASLQ